MTGKRTLSIAPKNPSTLRMSPDGLDWRVTAIPRAGAAPLLQLHIRGVRGAAVVDESRAVDLGQVAASIKELRHALGLAEDGAPPAAAPTVVRESPDLTEADVGQAIAAKQDRIATIDADMADLRRRRRALVGQVHTLRRTMVGRHTGLYRRIEELLGGEPGRGWKAGEVGQALGGVPTPAVGVAQAKLSQAGRIERVGVGVYAVARHGRAA